MTAVTALTTMAKQLKAAMDAAVDNEENARHLFERLRDNSHLLSAALMEGLSSPNPHLQIAIHNILDRLTKSLMQARDTIYHHLISRWFGALSFANLGGLIRAHEIAKQLRRAHEVLDRDLADLRGVLSFETWRLVRQGEAAAAAEVAAQLPAEAAEQLLELRAVAELRMPGGAAAKVVKQVARMVVGSPRDQQVAAKQLRERALICPDHRAALVAAGAIPVLVQLMASSGSEDVRLDAAALLASLAADGAPNQAVMIVMGGIQALAGLLLSEKSKQQDAAAAALHVLAFDSRTPAAAGGVAGGIAALVSLLVGSRPMAQDAAAAALHQILVSVAAADKAHAQAGVQKRQPYQPAIVAVGGVPALVWALYSGRAAAREGAAATLRCMATSQSSREKIQEAGGIPALVQLLGRSGEVAQRHAAAVLRRLAYSSPSNKAAIAAAGGIPALVRLLGCSCTPVRVLCSSCVAVQEGASATLGALAVGNPDNKTAIAAAGGIAALVRLLGCSCVAVQEGASATLGALAVGNLDNQTSIAAAGGIVALAQLLRSTCVPVQKQAGETLDALALSHPQNHQAIAAMRITYC